MALRFQSNPTTTTLPASGRISTHLALPRASILLRSRRLLALVLAMAGSSTPSKSATSEDLGISTVSQRSCPYHICSNFPSFAMLFCCASANHSRSNSFSNHNGQIQACRCTHEFVRLIYSTPPPPSRELIKYRMIYAVSSGPIPVEAMILVLSIDQKKYRCTIVTSTYLTTSTNWQIYIGGLATYLTTRL